VIDGIDVLIDLIKVLVIFGFLLTSVLLTIWAERRVVALMQQRIGPNRVGPFGMLQGLADGIKLFFKEDVIPGSVDRAVYLLAPVAALIPAFLAFAVVPFGRGFHLGDRAITMHLVDLNVGVLFFLAMGSLMVYGVVLAGWSSASTYPLLGAVRSTAQMISYEIGMGLSVVSVVLWAGTLSTSGIVDAQAGTWLGVVPRWNILPQLPAFAMFLLGGLAETNRAPFDLPEAETELVGGYHTEYTGIKFAMFFLAEYLHVITTSALVVTLFLGGWRGPNILPFLGPVLFVGYFLAKLGFVVFLFMWARATIPRIRYDRLMRLGWKILIPAALAWVMVTAAMAALPQEVDRTKLVVVVGIVFELAVIVALTQATKGALSRLRAHRGETGVV
jgi:NADH-quinone oxidoreductase subunit H